MPSNTEGAGSVDLRSLAKDVRDLLEDLKTRLELLEQRVSWTEEYIRHQEMDKEAASGREDPSHPRHVGHI